MTLISIIKQQQLLIYSTQFKLQTQRWMGNFIRENTSKREMLAGKKAMPVEIQASWEFLVALYPDSSSGYSHKYQVHLSEAFGVQAIPFYFPPEAVGIQGAEAAAQGSWAVWALLQDGHRDHQEGQGEERERSISPHLPGTTPQCCQRGSRTQDFCVSPRIGAAPWADGKLAFSSFYSCPQNQHMVCKPIRLTHGS